MPPLCSPSSLRGGVSRFERLATQDGGGGGLLNGFVHWHKAVNLPLKTHIGTAGTVGRQGVCVLTSLVAQGIKASRLHQGRG